MLAVRWRWLDRRWWEERGQAAKRPPPPRRLPHPVTIMTKCATEPKVDISSSKLNSCESTLAERVENLQRGSNGEQVGGRQLEKVSKERARAPLDDVLLRCRLYRRREQTSKSAEGEEEERS